MKTIKELLNIPVLLFSRTGKAVPWIRFLMTLLFLFFIMPLQSIGQSNILWQKCLGGTNYDEMHSMESTMDGGYILAGFSYSSDGDATYNHGMQDVWIVKLDSSGNIQWQKSYGGTGWEQVYSIKQTSDGGYIAVGMTDSGDGDVTLNHGLSDIWILKLNGSGLLQWQKTYGGTNYDCAYSVVQTSDMNYLLAGYTASSDGDVTGNHGGEDFWVLKVDSLGMLQWQKCFGGTSNDQASAVLQTSDGRYVAAGFALSSTGDVNGNHGGRDMWVIMMDNAGNMIWQKPLGGSSDEYADDIQETDEGGLVLAGRTYSNNNGDVSGYHGSGDVWIVKLGNSGNLQWQKCRGGTSTDQAFSIRQTSEGGYVVAGYTASNNGDVAGNHGLNDFWVVKTDMSGNMQWSKALGGTAAEYAKAVVQTNNKGFILAGYTSSNNGDVSGNHSSGYTDGWVIQLSPADNILGGIVYTDINGNCQPDAGEPRVANRLIQALPGPAFGTTDANGNYSLMLGAGNVTVSLVPVMYWDQDCPAGGGSYSVSLTSQFTSYSGYDFSTYITDTCADLKISAASALQRKCRGNNYYKIQVENRGSDTATNISAKLNLPGQLIPLSSSIPWTTGQPGEYFFSLGSMPPGTYSQFTIRDSVSCNALLGLVICLPQTVTMQETDCNAADNAQTDCRKVLSSYDPNDKRVASQNYMINGYVVNEDVQQGDTLSYFIRFQNTGNDTAFVVIVRDTLSQWLDPVSVVTDVASHPYTFRIIGYSVLEWRFDNIMLPDSFVNEPESNGLIKFHVLMRNGIPANTQILNKAYIYFDFNDPVITNQTISTLSGLVKIDEVNRTPDVQVYPNPNEGNFFLRHRLKGLITITGYDIFGRCVLRQSLYNEKGEDSVIPLNLATYGRGMYFIRVEGSDAIISEKVIVD